MQMQREHTYIHMYPHQPSTYTIMQYYLERKSLPLINSYMLLHTLLHVHTICISYNTGKSALPDIYARA